MLYTRKGDNGTTKAFDSKSGERVSKSSLRMEALGALDELNSFLGLVKVRAKETGLSLPDKPADEIISWIQNCIFSIQAEVAGAPNKLSSTSLEEIEAVTDSLEGEIPPIKTFFISGGDELSSLFDIARTLARKAERRTVGYREESSKQSMSEKTLAFLNRLSSCLYVCARYVNFKKGISEKAPWYNSDNN